MGAGAAGTLGLLIKEGAMKAPPAVGTVCAWIGTITLGWNIGTGIGCILLCLAEPCFVPGNNWENP